MVAAAVTDPSTAITIQRVKLCRSDFHSARDALNVGFQRVECRPSLRRSGAWSQAWSRWRSADARSQWRSGPPLSGFSFYRPWLYLGTVYRLARGQFLFASQCTNSGAAYTRFIASRRLRFVVRSVETLAFATEPSLGAVARMSSAFAEALAAGNTAEIRRAPKADLHSHSYFAAPVADVERVARPRSIARPPPSDGWSPRHAGLLAPGDQSLHG